jgi:Cytochrome c554 and c-prime
MNLLPALQFFKNKISIHKSTVVIIAFMGCVIIAIRCTSNNNVKEEVATEVKYSDYAGADKCMSCHKEVYDSFMHTAHYLTGKPAEEQFIKGSFAAGTNTYHYNPQLHIDMEKTDSGFYQVVYYKGEKKMSMRFDMVIGSGTKGQSFLTWRDNKLFQLPITYYTEANQWSVSPGLRTDKVVIDKPITSRCMECHASFVQALGEPQLEPMEFDRSKVILGVDCEKCHGPAAKHVEFQSANPQEKTGKHIVNPASLSRQLQLDACAVCHASNISKTKPSFQFIPGKSILDYFKVDSLSQVTVNNGNIDVHGNQYGLMTSSKCFRMSDKLTCNSCHNSHTNEKGSTALFSQRCIDCHSTTDAAFQTPSHKQVIAIDKNCIDCHMPTLPSRAIAVKLQGEDKMSASLIRSHFISVYEEETIKYLKAQKK